MSEVYIMFWVLMIGFLFIAMFANLTKKGSKGYNAEMPNKTITDFETIMKEENVEAVILCQCETSLPGIPQGDLCYLIAEKQRLTIKTKREPIMTYGLNYDKIYLFKIIEKSKKQVLDIGSFKTIEQKINYIVIQYIDEDSSIKELAFLFGETDEDKEFNQYALMRTNIFKIVEQRIPHRDNDVML